MVIKLHAQVMVIQLEVPVMVIQLQVHNGQTTLGACNGPTTSCMVLMSEDDNIKGKEIVDGCFFSDLGSGDKTTRSGDNTC